MDIIKESIRAMEIGPRGRMKPPALAPSEDLVRKLDAAQSTLNIVLKSAQDSAAKGQVIEGLEEDCEKAIYHIERVLEMLR